MVISGSEKENFMTGEREFAFNEPQPLPYEGLSSFEPTYLEISGTGTHVYLAWEDGWLLRIRCDDLEEAFIAEKGRLVPSGASLTGMRFILGESTLVWGDSQGNVRGGFPVRIDEGDVGRKFGCQAPKVDSYNSGGIAGQFSHRLEGAEYSLFNKSEC